MSASMAAGEYDHSPTAHLAYQAWCASWGRECLRVLKPGGHLLSFGAPRTAHHLACGIERAGFEIRDTVLWLFAGGFPKSYNLTGQWGGWHTALKPAYEPIALARKPLKLTTQRNAETHGTGALHTDACRIVSDEDGSARWPSNLIVGHTPDCDEERCTSDCPGVLLAQSVTTRRRRTPLPRFFYKGSSISVQ